jgi:glutamine amidotransferase
VGADVRVSSDPADVTAAERVVVPGQGAFGDCGRALARTAPLGRALVAAIERGTPYLGICLGLQVLFERSDEAPDCQGLGVFRGDVVRIPGDLRDHAGSDDSPRLKVPHMGWNEVVPAHPARRHALLAAVEHDLGLASPQGGSGVPFYFVHSFHAVPVEPRLVQATARYGPLDLTAAIGWENVFAVQFHPEKSQRAGQALLAAFLSWKP